MSAPNELRPMVLLTLDEGNELDTLIKKNYALVDLLNCIYSGPTDGPEPDSMEWISAMIFDNASDIKKLWEKGSDRESEARGVKAPEGPQPSE